MGRGDAAPLRLGDGGGVIVDDAPAFGEALPYEGKDAADVAFRSRQVPMTEEQERVAAKGSELELRKLQVAHGFAVGVGLFVAGENRVPAADDARSSGESDVRRVPVDGHEGI